jgi:hypothetical protein
MRPHLYLDTIRQAHDMPFASIIARDAMSGSDGAARMDHREKLSMLRRDWDANNLALRNSFETYATASSRLWMISALGLFGRVEFPGEGG